MNVLKQLKDLQKEMQEWRRDIHAHPEIAFEEHRTAKIVAEKLESFGIEVETGLASTGVVGTLKKGKGNRAIGLRADLDALPISEANDFEYKSKHEGLMHACGHDGHTAMLLGAAKYLSEQGDFDGTINFIFQPAEENEGGARTMIEEGLFEKYPVDSVYGMHNIPGMPVGTFAIKPGPIMAAFDIFEVKVIGKGGHAAMPQTTIDPIVIGSKIIDAFQSIVSRINDPTDNRLKGINNLRSDNYRIYSCLRHSSMTAFTYNLNFEDIKGSHDRTGLYSKCANRHTWNVMHAIN
jgi:hippurate hydrolase